MQSLKKKCRGKKERCLKKEKFLLSGTEREATSTKQILALFSPQLPTICELTGAWLELSCGWFLLLLFKHRTFQCSFSFVGIYSLCLRDKQITNSSFEAQISDWFKAPQGEQDYQLRNSLGLGITVAIWTWGLTLTAHSGRYNVLPGQIPSMEALKTQLLAALSDLVWPRADLLWGRMDLLRSPPDQVILRPHGRDRVPHASITQPSQCVTNLWHSWLPALVQSHFPAGYMIQEQDPRADHASSFLTLTQPVTYKELRTVHPFRFHEWNTTFHGFTALSHDQM